MKKLLSIIAAIGLTATTSTTVVACTQTVKMNDEKINQDEIGANYIGDGEYEAIYDAKSAEKANLIAKDRDGSYFPAIAWIEEQKNDDGTITPRHLDIKVKSVKDKDKNQVKFSTPTVKFELKDDGSISGSVGISFFVLNYTQVNDVKKTKLKIEFEYNSLSVQNE